MAAAAAAGLLPGTTTVVWPEEGPEPDGRDVEAPSGLQIQHFRGIPEGLVRGPLLVLDGELLLGHGALARWLRSGDDNGAGRPGVVRLDGDDPVLLARDAARLRAWLDGSSGNGAAAAANGAPLWMRVREPAEASRGERRLFASLGKSTDGLAARLLNRPISTRLSRRLTRLGVSPDVWTAMLLLMMGLSAVVLARGDYAGFVLGAVLFNLISILDGCDGELARVRYRESTRGARLDTFADMLSHHVFVVALGVGLARQPVLSAAWQATYLAEGVLTAGGIALALWGAAAVDRGWQQEGHFRDFGTSVLDSAALTGPRRRLGRLIADLTRQDSYHWILIVAALVGLPAWILHAFAIGVVAHLVALVYVWLKARQGAQVPRTSEP